MRRVLLLVALASCGSKEAIDALERSKSELAKTAVLKLANEAFVQWSLKNTEKGCPASVSELWEFVGRDPNSVDPWGRPYRMHCGAELPAGARGIAIFSTGPDQREGTPDDVKSW